MTSKRKTIGLRVPDNKIALDLLSALGEPILFLFVNVAE